MMTNDVQQLLRCSFAICIFSLEKRLFRSFEAYVILCTFCLRRKFGRTVAFHFVCGITTSYNQCAPPLPLCVHGGCRPRLPPSIPARMPPSQRPFLIIESEDGLSPPVSLTSLTLFGFPTVHVSLSDIIIKFCWFVSPSGM